MKNLFLILGFASFSLFSEEEQTVLGEELSPEEYAELYEEEIFEFEDSEEEDTAYGEETLSE